ncbi:MAG: hypothetical protein GY943_16445 [Chloroflexi bacterium]|nr:hypothetical protein [Chloroflexota bacterium]
MSIYRNYKKRKKELEVQALGCVFAFIALFFGGLLSLFFLQWNPLLSILILVMLMINAFLLSSIALYISKFWALPYTFSYKISIWLWVLIFLALGIATLPVTWRAIQDFWLQNYGASTNATIINQQRVVDRNIISYDITYEWEAILENGRSETYVAEININKGEFNSLGSSQLIHLRYQPRNPANHRVQEPFANSRLGIIFFPVWFYIFVIISTGIYLASQKPRNKYYSQKA